MTDRPGRTTRTPLWQVRDGTARRGRDAVATEEPLEIRLDIRARVRSVAVTMRTPGDDFELAAGFLHGEGVVTHADDIQGMAYCQDPGVDAAQSYNVVTVRLHPGATPDLRPLERHFMTTSACGVCGKATLEALQLRGCPAPPTGLTVTREVIVSLPQQLRAAQPIFERTGGLHAAALFDLDGRLLALREDVGRHNALDKLIGWALLQRHLPLDRHIVLVSGRASYELVQKALAAGVPIVCAVSAPSSLAVQMARSFGMTLIGFLRAERFNVYAGAERLAGLNPSPAATDA